MDSEGVDGTYGDTGYVSAFIRQSFGALSNLNNVLETVALILFQYL